MLLRPAKMTDAHMLFQWRNDPLTCAMSLNPEPVEWESHLSWLKARLGREDPGLFIAENDYPVGTVRIDGEEISYTVSPDHRRKGYAKAMLKAAKTMFGTKVAKIKAENLASIKAATSAGHSVELI